MYPPLFFVVFNIIKEFFQDEYVVRANPLQQVSMFVLFLYKAYSHFLCGVDFNLLIYLLNIRVIFDRETII